jgi:signal transduction histidine kinase
LAAERYGVKRNRDPILWIAALLAAAVTLLVAVQSTAWIDRPFAGFLLLGNRVVASAGLSHWPAIRDGEIYQHEVVSVDGSPLARATDLAALVALRPVGSELHYGLRRGDERLVRSIATRRFTRFDYVLLFGAYLASGLCLVGASLGIRYLGRDVAARSGALPLWIVGMFAITAIDLYGPYQLFRAHAFLECILAAAVLQFTLIFPFPRRIAMRRRWLVPSIYAPGIALGAFTALRLDEPASYVAAHRFAIGAFGAALVALVAAQIWTYLRPPSFEARQRVKVVTFGAIAALLPPAFLTIGSAVSGGTGSENFAGISAAIFPLSIAYAVLRADLLEIDTILRRAVGYVTISITVALAFVALFAMLQDVLRTLEVGGGSAPILLAALAVSALLPLRDRVQSAVDRVFFRSSYDFRRLVDQTSERLASVTDLETISEQILRVAREALDPERVRFEARSDATAPGADGDDTPAALQIRELADGGLVVPFVIEGRTVAELELGRRLSGRTYGGEDRRLLRIFSHQGAVAVENAFALARVQELNETLERKVEERTAELEEALSSLRKAQQQIVQQEKMASLGLLVAGVAHEINNPLNFIEGNLFHLREHTASLTAALGDYEAATKQADAALARRLDEVRNAHDVAFVLSDLPSLLAACDEGVARATTIVKELRTFSRTDGGRLSQLDVSASLEATLNLLRARLDGIEVRRDFEPLPLVECLEGQIGQVFMNLLANAADALAGRGTISIRTRALPGERVLVEVEDSGPGIPADVLGRIFEPFFTTKEVGKGTGLGLAISYGIVARHGGTIRVRSEEGHGTCFSVELPIAAAVNAAAGERLQTPLHVTDSGERSCV